MTKKFKVLFLCTGNSCRSQMAEGWARHLKSDLIEPYSAGIEIHGVLLQILTFFKIFVIDIYKNWTMELEI